MNTDDVQYLDWQWVEEHPESALDLMLKLHSENAALRSIAAAMADEMEHHGGEMAFDSLAQYRAAMAKEDKP